VTRIQEASSIKSGEMQLTQWSESYVVWAIRHLSSNNTSLTLASEKSDIGRTSVIMVGGQQL